MIEQYTEGIVLSRSPSGEQDGSVVLYTKDLGKISTFARSIRKPTSKLSGHLMPGNFVRMRVLQKNKLQAVDVLSEKPKCPPEDILQFVRFMDQVVPYGEPNLALWQVFEEMLSECRLGPKVYGYVLVLLGFGSDTAVCGVCGNTQIAYFHAPDIMFLCSSCRMEGSPHSDELIAISGD